MYTHVYTHAHTHVLHTYKVVQCPSAVVGLTIFITRSRSDTVHLKSKNSTATSTKEPMLSSLVLEHSHLCRCAFSFHLIFVFVKFYLKTVYLLIHPFVVSCCFQCSGHASCPLSLSVCFFILIATQLSLHPPRLLQQCSDFSKLRSLALKHERQL